MGFSFQKFLLYNSLHMLMVIRQYVLTLINRELNGVFLGNSLISYSVRNRRASPSHLQKVNVDPFLLHAPKSSGFNVYVRNSMFLRQSLLSMLTTEVQKTHGEPRISRTDETYCC